MQMLIRQLLIFIWVLFLLTQSCIAFDEDEWEISIPAGVPADQTLFPTADSSTYNDWTPSSGIDKYAMVDETPHDSATTYISISDANGDQYFTNNPTLPSGTILGVRVYYVDYEYAGAAGIRPALLVNGTVYEGDYVGSEATWTERYYEWATNPDTSAAWTKADVEGSGSNPLQEWGIDSSSVGVGDTLRVTQVRLVVRYN